MKESLKIVVDFILCRGEYHIHIVVSYLGSGTQLLWADHAARRTSLVRHYLMLITTILPLLVSPQLDLSMFIRISPVLEMARRPTRTKDT